MFFFASLKFLHGYILVIYLYYQFHKVFMTICHDVVKLKCFVPISFKHLKLGISLGALNK